MRDFGLGAGAVSVLSARRSVDVRGIPRRRCRAKGAKRRLRALDDLAIHHFRMMLFRKWMDTRVKPAYDG
jgi:hypothetical protein